jgi:hypothetical protein
MGDHRGLWEWLFRLCDKRFGRFEQRTIQATNSKCRFVGSRGGGGGTHDDDDDDIFVSSFDAITTNTYKVNEVEADSFAECLVVARNSGDHQRQGSTGSRSRCSYQNIVVVVIRKRAMCFIEVIGWKMERERNE